VAKEVNNGVTLFNEFRAIVIRYFGSATDQEPDPDNGIPRDLDDGILPLYLLFHQTTQLALQWYSTICGGLLEFCPQDISNFNVLKHCIPDNASFLPHYNSKQLNRRILVRDCRSHVTLRALIRLVESEASWAHTHKEPRSSKSSRKVTK
jgi:hypothetical protein